MSGSLSWSSTCDRLVAEQVMPIILSSESKVTQSEEVSDENDDDDESNVSEEGRSAVEARIDKPNIVGDKEKIVVMSITITRIISGFTC